MIARCKFRVMSVRDFGTSAREVELFTQYDSSIPEDVRFAKATPTGHVVVTIDNPEVMKGLVPGAMFYVDLIPVTTEFGD